MKKENIMKFLAYVPYTAEVLFKRKSKTNLIQQFKLCEFEIEDANNIELLMRYNENIYDSSINKNFIDLFIYKGNAYIDETKYDTAENKELSILTDFWKNFFLEEKDLIAKNYNKICFEFDSYRNNEEVYKNEIKEIIKTDFEQSYSKIKNNIAQNCIYDDGIIYKKTKLPTIMSKVNLRRHSKFSYLYCDINILFDNKEIKDNYYLEEFDYMLECLENDFNKKIKQIEDLQEKEISTKDFYDFIEIMKSEIQINKDILSKYDTKKKYKTLFKETYEYLIKHFDDEKISIFTKEQAVLYFDLKEFYSKNLDIDNEEIDIDNACLYLDKFIDKFFTNDSEEYSLSKRSRYYITAEQLVNRYKNMNIEDNLDKEEEIILKI